MTACVVRERVREAAGAATDRLLPRARSLTLSPPPPCSVYEAPEMGLLDKRSLKMENIEARVCAATYEHECMLDSRCPLTEACLLTSCHSSRPR